MARSMLFTALLALSLAGCATVNPAGSAVPTDSGFQTKLLNTISLGSQGASQTNYVPNTQLNQATQNIIANATAQFPIAALIGSGAATGTNTVAQTLANVTTQTQTQSQLVL